RCAAVWSTRRTRRIRHRCRYRAGVRATLSDKCVTGSGRGNPVRILVINRIAGFTTIRCRGTFVATPAGTHPMTTSAVRTTSVAQEHRLQELIAQLHAKHVPLTAGQVATYIPELGKANPEHFGI